MTTPSLTGWTWLRQPSVTVENGLVVGDVAGERYSPGADCARLLNAIVGVREEADAASFVRQWGLLGFAGALPSTTSPAAGFESVWGLTWILREDERSGVIEGDIGSETAAWLAQPNATKEPVQLILQFAEDMRALSEVIRIIGSFSEDPYAANYDAEQWIKGLPRERHKALVASSQKTHGVMRGLGSTEPYDSKYVLTTLTKTARLQFSDRSQRGIWVKLSRATGRVGLEFDGLFRFIEYVLLSDNAPSPSRCEDPQCGQLFFPIRSSRRYCPPPPGCKRSLCEQRHSKQLRRSSSRVPTDAKKAPPVDAKPL